MRFTGRDAAALTLIAEQYAAPYDLLAGYLGVTPSRLRSVITRWKRAGLVDSAPLTGARGWAWITRHGLDVLGFPWKASRPSLARLAHHRAVLATRLWYEARPEYRRQGAAWRSEREIRAAVPAVPAPGHLVDAEITWPGAGQTWAIEVELTPKELDRTIRIIAGLLRQPYDRVVYLCDTPALPIVKRAADVLRDRPDAARLAIHGIPPQARLHPPRT